MSGAIIAINHLIISAPVNAFFSVLEYCFVFNRNAKTFKVTYMLPYSERVTVKLETNTFTD